MFLPLDYSMTVKSRLLEYHLMDVVAKDLQVKCIKNGKLQEEQGIAEVFHDKEWPVDFQESPHIPPSTNTSVVLPPLVRPTHKLTAFF